MLYIYPMCLVGEMMPLLTTEGKLLHVHLGFHTGFFFGGEGKKFVGHCNSVMHEYETIQIFKFSGGGIIEAGEGEKFQGTPPPV